MKFYIHQLFKKLPFLLALRLTILFIAKRLMLNETNFYFSQTGEDIVIKHLLGKQLIGTYVDVGCNKPIYFSNTFNLYLMGWKGLCIDANEAICDLFKKTRPMDTVITEAVSDEEKEVTFYISDRVSAVSTLDQNHMNEWSQKLHFNREVSLKTQRLENILDRYLEKETVIDLLSIDVEGHDLNVLKSINLNKYRPRFIVIEIHNFSLARQSESPLVNYLQQNQYELQFFATINGYFKDVRG